MGLRKKIASERQEQCALVRWGKLKHLAMIKISNEGKRSKRTGAIMRLEGLEKGFLDLLIPEPTNIYHGAFIEMKQNRKYSASEQNTELWKLQEMWINYLNRRNYYAFRAYGWQDAVEKLEKVYFFS